MPPAAPPGDPPAVQDDHVHGLGGRIPHLPAKLPQGLLDLQLVLTVEEEDHRDVFAVFRE
jgi:hypothetical protein